MSAAGATGEDRLSLMIPRSVTEVPVPVWCNKATEASVANRRGRVGCGPRVLNVASGHA